MRFGQRAHFVRTFVTGSETLVDSISREKEGINSALEVFGLSKAAESRCHQSSVGLAAKAVPALVNSGLADLMPALPVKFGSTTRGSPNLTSANSRSNRVLPVPFRPNMNEIEFPGALSCLIASVCIRSPGSILPLGLSGALAVESLVPLRPERSNRPRILESASSV